MILLLRRSDILLSSLFLESCAAFFGSILPVLPLASSHCEQKLVSFARLNDLLDVSTAHTG